MTLPILTPSEFTALLNQTLEFAYPLVEIEGEVLNYRVSKGRWVYFDIADETAKLRCFGTVYMLPAPVEDGMKVRVVAAPRLHPQFGFSLNLQSLSFSGEGTIKKAADLLYGKLEKEGLFAVERKRTLPFPPERIALVTSEESAAYKDFLKVLAGRYGGMDIMLANVQVQGEPAVGQIVRAIEHFNAMAELPDVLVLTRGGGSPDDLQAFSSEQVTRAVAASRIPTLVAIGHEADTSLAELAADRRASTPSNAAELLVPDRREGLQVLAQIRVQLNGLASQQVQTYRDNLESSRAHMQRLIENRMQASHERLTLLLRTLEALSPAATLRRGYSVVRSGGKVVRSAKQLTKGQEIAIEFAEGTTSAEVQ